MIRERQGRPPLAGRNVDLLELFLPAAVALPVAAVASGAIATGRQVAQPASEQPPAGPLHEGHSHDGRSQVGMSHVGMSQAQSMNPTANAGRPGRIAAAPHLSKRRRNRAIPLNRP